ncbi:MAG: hypothetical protein RIS38_1158 [Verrucomicrobiota bacterium]
MIRARRWLAATWGALVLPLFVCAHDGEALMARLTLRADGSCALQVTADLEANLRIKDEAELARAAAGLFAVSTERDQSPLDSLAGPPAISAATKLDPDAPIPTPAEELTKTFRLGRAEWRWTPAPRNFVLRLPPDCPHTVLLWLVDETKPELKPRWVMMIAGDESPLIQAHEPSAMTGRRMLLVCGGAMLVLALFVALGFYLLSRRRRRTA